MTLRAANCSGVSTPSATTVRPRACASDTIAVTIVGSGSGGARSSTNDWSTFKMSNGNLRRYARPEARPLPTQQRLEADDLPVRDADERLVEHSELTAAHGFL